jgi:hypothetical protein
MNKIRFLKSKAMALLFAMLLTASFAGAALASDCDPVYYQGSNECPTCYEECTLDLAIVYEDGSEQCFYTCTLQIEY